MKRLIPWLFFLLPLSLMAQQAEIWRVEPPFWWTGFKNASLQLMVYGKDIAKTGVSIAGNKQETLMITSVHKVPNPNYLFVDLKIGKACKPGFFTLNFSRDSRVTVSCKYELKARQAGSAARKGFSNADVIYLIMPDRFANGDTANDNIPGMREKADRARPDRMAVPMAGSSRPRSVFCNASGCSKISLSMKCS